MPPFPILEEKHKDKLEGDDKDSKDSKHAHDYEHEDEHEEKLTDKFEDHDKIKELANLLKAPYAQMADRIATAVVSSLRPKA